MVLRLRAGARAELEQHRLGLGEVHDRGHRVLDAVDEAGAALRARLDADVEPDRRVEAHLLVDEKMGQLGLEGLEVRVGREVVLRLGPAGDREDDPVDQLADARLALLGAEVAAEVLADDDVRRELRPEVRDLDVLLLEDELAGLVADRGGPGLPGDLVVGVDARGGPAALEGEALGRVAVAVGAVEAGLVRAARAGGGRWRRPFRLRARARCLPRAP